MDNSESSQMNASAWTNAASDSVDSARDTMELLLSASDVTAVYAEPVEHGANLIIPAAEVLSVAGFGMGTGGGGDAQKPENGGGGGGGGGGGRVFARPVAVIVSTAEGVRVEPVFDRTKIALAAITAFGFMIATVSRMQARRLHIKD
jgi:uncharacterized spore protein YtfJ